MNEQYSKSRKYQLAYYYRLKAKSKCPQCGGIIGPRFKKNKSVCRKCSSLNLIGKHRGTQSPNWKGGRCQNPQGYILIYKPEHPAAKTAKNYVFEHRLIWEEAHGQLLPKGWVIHHLNGIKDDNRRENLYALSRRDHTGMKFFKVLQQRIRFLESSIRELKGNNYSHLL